MTERDLLDGMTFWQSEEYLLALENHPGISKNEGDSRSDGARKKVVVDASKCSLSKALAKAGVR